MRNLIEGPLLILQHLRGRAPQGALASGLQQHVPGGVVTKWRWAVRFIRPREVVEMIGVSRTTLWRMVREGTFPRPVRITERNVRYVLEAVEAWMQARTEGLIPEPVGEGTGEPRRVPSRARRAELELARDASGVHG
jgi:prophage regulatory protein